MNLSVQPTVSIIIPAYNPPMDLFKKCVATILNQGELNSEILIVDDGSKPEIAAAIDNVAASEKNIRVIHQINAGEGAARNTGLDSATGKYILFVDADDGLASGWLATALGIAEETHASVVMGRVVQVPEVPDHVDLEPSFASHLYTKDELWVLQRDFLLNSTTLVGSLPYLDPGVCSKLIRHECIRELRFPIGLKLSSDQVFNHMILRCADSYVVTDKTAYYYVSNSESISHVYNPDAASVMMKSMALVEQSLFNKKDVKQAFYFRVLMEIGTAIQFAAFSDRHSIGLSEKKKVIAEAACEPMVIKALGSLDISTLPDFSWKVKAYLLRHRLYSLYIFLKRLSD